MTRLLAEHLEDAHVKRSRVLLVIEHGATRSSQYWAGSMPAALTFLHETPPAP
jgi:hypothetical protein